MTEEDKVWGLRAQIGELKDELEKRAMHIDKVSSLYRTAKKTAELMLQEREFFAKQIRDIRAAWAGGKLDELALSEILARRNPMP